MMSHYDPNTDTDLLHRIEDGLDSIRPYLIANGGEVRVHRITQDMVVEIELLGTCGSCPMSTMTMKAGIEQALRHAVPQISGVEAV